MIVPVFSLDACLVDKINMHTKIFNKSKLEYYLWIHIPEKISNTCQFFQVNEMCPNPVESRFFKHFEHESGKPWVKVVTKVLNTEVGMHTYQLLFVNKLTNDVVTLYISYIIQDDNPDKPYIYMNRESTK